MYVSMNTYQIKKNKIIKFNNILCHMKQGLIEDNYFTILLKMTQKKKKTGKQAIEKTRVKNKCEMN